MKAGFFIMRSPSILEIGQQFMAALAARDFNQLQDSFQESVQFRALVPTGIRGGIGAEEAVAWLEHWFGEADEFQVLASTMEQIADRLHIAYRFRVFKNGEWQIVEQQAYCTVSDSQIGVMHLISSGFRPEPLTPTAENDEVLFDRTN
jgi:hypothetical protein